MGFLLSFLGLVLVLSSEGFSASDVLDKSATAVAAQTDPAKLATLKGKRAANPRVQRCVYWLATAEEAGIKPKEVLNKASQINGTKGTPYAEFIEQGLLRNLKIAQELGLINELGMEEMRRGKSAKITLGPYAGQEATVDHVIPLSVCLELDNQVLNLELLPASLNSSKRDKVTERAIAFAKELNNAGLLSNDALLKLKELSKKM
jgi:hypothetical protein